MKKWAREASLILLAGFVFSPQVRCHAAGTGKKTESARPNSPPPGADSQKTPFAGQDLTKMQLEGLKQTNPEAYEQAKKMISLQDKINNVITDFQENKLTQEEAEQKLFPWVKEMMKPEIDAVPARIEKLRRELDFLLDVRKDSGLLVQRRLRQMLAPQPAFPVPLDSSLMEP